MTHLRTTYKYLTVIALGFLVFMLDFLELASPFVNEVLLFGVSAAKSAYFIWFTFSNIRAAAQREFYFHEFVPFVALSVLLIILSFGIDYYCLHRINPKAFAGDFGPGSLADTLVSFLYFSVTTFTTAGLGEIVPHSISARVFVMLELFIAFFFTILVIANIAQIRESFFQKSNKNNP